MVCTLTETSKTRRKGKGYEMSFSAKGELIYLAHPRTASIATERALSKIFPTRSKKTKNHHAQLHEIDYRQGDEKIFTTIRDPLDMITSWWEAQTSRHHIGLTRFIQEYKHSMMERNGHLFYFLEDAHEHLRFENLQIDFDRLMLKWGYSPRILEVTNVTKNKKPFMEYHTEETIAAMWKRWPKDMDMYHGIS